MTFGIVGLGLMGGGFARAIRNAADCGRLPEDNLEILACDNNEDVLKAASVNGIIDSWFTMISAGNMLKKCDVVFVCLYPDDTFSFIKEHAADFKPSAIVTDIAGVKGNRVSECEKCCPQYIAGHPMAGSDREGFSHSSTVRFQGRNYIVMPRQAAPDKERLERFKEIISALGFGQIIETDTTTHDSKIAFTSQLCHVIASALVDCAEDERVTQFGGGSFEDLTRIAMINAPLWTELFLSNKDALLPHVDSFLDSMQKFRAAIADDDAESLERYLAAVRTKRALMRKTESSASN